MNENVSAIRVGELRALVASLSGYADDLPITVYFDGKLGPAIGLEVIEREEPGQAPIGLVLSLEKYQHGSGYR